MIEESLIQFGGMGVAVFVLWDSNRKIANALNNLAEKIEFCPTNKKYRGTK